MLTVVVQPHIGHINRGLQAMVRTANRTTEGNRSFFERKKSIHLDDTNSCINVHMTLNAYHPKKMEYNCSSILRSQNLEN